MPPDRQHALAEREAEQAFTRALREKREPARRKSGQRRRMDDAGLGRDGPDRFEVVPFEAHRVRGGGILPS